MWGNVTANARSRYEALAAFLQQYKGAQIGRLYGMPCLLFDGEPFMMLHRESVAFRLNGRALTNALGLSGSTGFDPLHPDQPPPGRPGWVLVATAHFLSWDRLAVDAMRCASLAKQQPVSWKPPPEPPPPPPMPPRSTPKSLAERVAAVMKSGFGFGLFDRDGK